jgi:anti-sigma regulatory factor (Ser/Thr protein kinase)
MVDEALSPDGGLARGLGLPARGLGLPADPVNSASFGTVPAPRGFAARFFPPTLVGYWLEIIPMPAGQTGVLLGCDSAAGAAAVVSDLRSTLQRTADPVRSLAAVNGSGASALAAILDADTISYSTHGDSAVVIAVPGLPSVALDAATDRVAVATLMPGSTVLLSSGPGGRTAALRDGSGAVVIESLADEVIVSLGERGRAAAVLYRHPPAPLTITLPAHPASLAISRAKLREWLAAAGLSSESVADILLAVGEATANATEHAVLGATEPVEICLTAAIHGDVLELSVSDNGRWKPASASSGHRGHGMHLINALADTVELRTGAEGTTVSMTKELSR